MIRSGRIRDGKTMLALLYVDGSESLKARRRVMGRAERVASG